MGTAISSIVIPGLGHVLCGRFIRGAMFFVFTLVGYAAFILPGIFMHIWCVFDSVKVAEGKDVDKLARAIRKAKTP